MGEKKRSNRKEKDVKEERGREKKKMERNITEEFHEGDEIPRKEREVKRRR